ncbi:hypothetical protein XENOCAPTIV_008246 [Xenoophorus captivus]|uniref:Uncharacterized protein n=1 Tax=Xenoophorus captivus TaxID=1517983 RepID=A0ABV0SA06_9TELE
MPSGMCDASPGLETKHRKQGETEKRTHTLTHTHTHTQTGEEVHIVKDLIKLRDREESSAVAQFTHSLVFSHRSSVLNHLNFSKLVPSFSFLTRLSLHDHGHNNTPLKEDIYYESSLF